MPRKPLERKSRRLRQGGIAPLFPAVFLTLLILLPVSAANAQQRIDPRQTERNLDSLLSREKNTKPSIGLPRLQPGAEAAASSVVFLLKSVSLEGATQIEKSTLAEVYRPFIGKTVTQKELNDIATGIGSIYRDQGFHLSRAIIPPQDVANGRLRIRVLEGFITEIVVKGDEKGKFGVRNLLDPIMTERPSRLSTLERYLMLTNDRFGVRVADASVEEVRPATGRFRLVVQLETWGIYSALGVDNWGTKPIGELQTYLAIAYNSSFVSGDSLGFDLSITPEDTRELRFGRIYYDMPVNREGARIGWSASHSEIYPGDARRLVHTNVSVDSFEIRGSINPLNTREQSLRLIGVAGFLEEREQNDLGKNYEDRVVTIAGVIDYRKKDSAGGWNYLTFGLRQGLDIMGASSSGDALLSRVDGSGSFTKADLSITRIQRLNEIWSTKFSVTGQWASRAVLASQEFYLGGPAFGRAYNSAIVSGDHGAAAAIEIRYDKETAYQYLKGYQLYAFGDGGFASNIGGPEYSLASAGLGTRFFLVGDVLADIGVAFPVAQSATIVEPKNPRYFFSVSRYFKLCKDQTAHRCL